MKIIISSQNDNFNLIVEDNGTGFDPNKSTDRNGVKNIHARTAALKGDVKLKTDLGIGTKWELTFPL